MVNTVTYASGWGNEPKTFVIPSGANGSAIGAVDFLRPYWGIIIRCEDVTGISGQTFSLDVGYSDGDADLVILVNAELARDWASGTISVAFGGMVLAATGVQKLRIVLSGTASQDTTFTIIGVDPGRGEGV